MSYCSNCGTNVNNANFCPNCGAQINASQTNNDASTAGKVVGTVVGVSALHHLWHHITRPRRPIGPMYGHHDHCGGPHGGGHMGHR
jgi:hypothetical protein